MSAIKQYYHDEIVKNASIDICSKAVEKVARFCFQNNCSLTSEFSLNSEIPYLTLIAFNNKNFKTFAMCFTVEDERYLIDNEMEFFISQVEKIVI